MHTESIRTNWFSYPIKAADGREFYVLEELCAEIEVCDVGEIASVEAIFTEYGSGANTTRVYLPKDHPLYAEIELHVLSAPDMVPDDWQEAFEPDEYDRVDGDHYHHLQADYAE